MTYKIVLALAIASILAASSIFPASATLTSTSPTTVITATATQTWTPHWALVSEHRNCSFFFGCFSVDLLFQEVWTAGPLTMTSQTTGAYNLDVKSLQPLTVTVSGNTPHTTLGIQFAGSPSQGLPLGPTTFSSPTKGVATITVAGTTVESVARSSVESMGASLPHPFASQTCPLPSGTCSPPSLPVILPATFTDTEMDSFTLGIDQPNAGGPKPRLSMDSGANLVAFSSATGIQQFINIPAKGMSLTVSSTSGTVTITDQHGATRGTPAGTVTVPLGSGDYSGLWTVAVTGAGNTKISAIVDGTSLPLLSSVQ